MKIFDWLTGSFSPRGKALTLYRRGMASANANDELGAIDDYTLTINLSGAPLDVVAMALFNRALAYVSIGEDSKGTHDLDAVLAMENAPARIKERARQKLVRMKHRPEENNRETI